ncbi:hypothetical protein D3C84_631880 [compost metagenome]
MGVAMFLLPTGPVSQPYNATQIAAWVPADQVNSMDEAARLVERTIDEARRKNFANPSRITIAASAYPGAHARAYKSFSDLMTKKPVPPAGEPGKAPSFLKDGLFYGPIFAPEFDSQQSSDALKNDLDPHEALAMLSADLPEWIALYNPGRRGQRNELGYPPSIMLKGQEYFFVGK